MVGSHHHWRSSTKVIDIMNCSYRTCASQNLVELTDINRKYFNISWNVKFNRKKTATTKQTNDYHWNEIYLKMKGRLNVCLRIYRATTNQWTTVWTCKFIPIYLYSKQKIVYILNVLFQFRTKEKKMKKKVKKKIGSISKTDK